MMDKIFWNFEIQIDHLIPIRKPEFVLRKTNLSLSEFCCSLSPQKKNKRKQNNGQILGPVQGTKKTVEHKDDSDTTYNWCTWSNSRRLRKKTGELEIKRRTKTIQTTALLRSARCSRTENTCCHSDSSKKSPANPGVKNLQRVNDDKNDNNNFNNNNDN